MQLINIHEAKKITGLSAKTLQRLRQQRKITSYRLSYNAVRYDKQSLLNYIDKRKREAVWAWAFGVNYVITIIIFINNQIFIKGNFITIVKPLFSNEIKIKYVFYMCHLVAFVSTPSKTYWYNSLPYALSVVVAWLFS